MFGNKQVIAQMGAQGDWGLQMELLCLNVWNSEWRLINEGSEPSYEVINKLVVPKESLFYSLKLETYSSWIKFLRFTISDQTSVLRMLGWWVTSQPPVIFDEANFSRIFHVSHRGFNSNYFTLVMQVKLLLPQQK